MLQHTTNHSEDAGQEKSLQGKMIKMVTGTPRRRMVVRRGMEYVLLRIEEIVLLYTESKMVYIIDQEGKKYMGEKNLSECMTELDESMFFRANRQYIVNIGFIKSFKTYEKVKLQVALTIPDLSSHSIIVSQENAPHFRQWIGG